MNFNQLNLDSRLLAGITRAGYHTPTPIQARCIPLALSGKDLIGTAQTGTGKTAAFVLPILQKLLSRPARQTRALIVTPTRELAEQIHENIRSLGAGTRIRSAAIYGGVKAAPQIKALRDGVEIVVACPGRLLDLIGQGHAKLDRVEILVLDEADRMLDMGFLPDVKRILAFLPGRRQTMLFSATFPKEIEKLASQALRHPQRVDIGLRRPVYTVEHTLYPVPQHLKTGLLLTLLKQMGKGPVLVFTRTRHRARKLAKKIGRSGFKVTSLHSDRTQGQRRTALDGFKAGTYHIMVATDIAARGLDIENISHVINFDMPDTADTYIHRIGRTGRAKRSGLAFTFVTPTDKAMVQDLEEIMGHTITRHRIEDFDYNASSSLQGAYPDRQSQPIPGSRSNKPNRHRKSRPRQRQESRSHS